MKAIYAGFMIVVCLDGSLYAMEESSHRSYMRVVDPWWTMEEAVRTGNVEKVRSILDSDGDVNMEVAGEIPLLIYASRYGHCDLVQLLLDRGAEVDAKNREGETALYGVFTGDYGVNVKDRLNDRLKIAKLLLDRGVDVDARSGFYGFTALYRAVNCGCVKVAELLLNGGATVDLPTFYGAAPLHVAAKSGHFDLVRLLLNHRAEPNIRDYGGRTPLHKASRKGYLGIVQLFLDRNIDPNVEDNRGRTPLHRATGRGRRDVVNVLLNGGADVNASARGCRAFTSLFMCSNCEIAKLLLDHGAMIDVMDSSGSTPLRDAAEWGRKDKVELLLDRGADVNGKDRGGWTPLRFAAVNKHLEIVRLLLDRGADVSGNSYRLADTWSYDPEIRQLILRETQRRAETLALSLEKTGMHHDAIKEVLFRFDPTYRRREQEYRES